MVILAILSILAITIIFILRSKLNIAQKIIFTLSIILIFIFCISYLFVTGFDRGMDERREHNSLGEILNKETAYDIICTANRTDYIKILEGISLPKG